MRALQLTALATLGLVLSGCSTIGSLAMGTAELVGQTTLLVADLATFGALSTLTGSEDEAWAVSASDSASAYSTYTTARFSTPTASYVPPVSYASNSGAAPTTSSNSSVTSSTAQSSAHSRYAPFSCVSVVHSSGNDVIRNSCGKVIEAHWYDADGGWNMMSIQSDWTVYGAKVSGLWACDKNDSLDKSAHVCIDNDGSSRW